MSYTALHYIQETHSVHQERKILLRENEKKFDSIIYVLVNPVEKIQITLISAKRWVPVIYYRDFRF